MSGATTATGGLGRDDRAVAWAMLNADTPSPYYEQYLGAYAETHITNPATTCHPASTETAAGGLRHIIIDERESGTPISGGLGVVGLTGLVFSAANFSTPVTGTGYSGVVGFAQNNNTKSLSGSICAGVTGGIADYTNAPNGSGYSFRALAPLGGRFSSFNVGYYVQDFGTNINDFNVYSQSSASNSGQNFFQGPTIVASDLRTASAGGSNPGNTDTAGILTLVNGTVSYTFKNLANTQPPIAIASWTGVGILQGTLQVSCTKTTLTITSTNNTDTAQVNYICVARN